MTRNTALKNVKTLGDRLAALGAQTTSVTWQLADAVSVLFGTYGDKPEHRKAAKAAAATASGKSEGFIENLVRAVKVRNELTAEQRTATKDWGIDAMLVLSGTTAQKRTSIIGKAAKAETTNVKTIRGFKGSKARTGRSSAEQTKALGKVISKDVAKLLKNGHDPVALAAGARLAQKYPGKDVAAALLLVSGMIAKAAKETAAS